MIYYEDAKIVDAMELKNMVEMHCVNPTVEALRFIELKANGDNTTPLFPCFMEAWSEDDNPSINEREGRKWLMFKCTVIQYKDGEFETLPIYLHEKEFEIRKRVWDKPPTAALRKSKPFVYETIQ